jgi:membrane-associated phospholipid phosphatase
MSWPLKSLRKTAFYAAFCASALPNTAHAACKQPWQFVDVTLRELARPTPIAALLTGVAAPLALAPNGADYKLRSFSQTTLHGRYNPEPVSPLAPLGALGITLVAYGIAQISDGCESHSAPAAMLQAAFWTLSLTAVTKFTTGRSWPNAGRDPGAADRLFHPGDAQDFRPFQRGLAAFPSGHTATLFALAAALRESGTEFGWLRFLGYPLATLVGFGMWWGDHHFASDVLAGACLGEALGTATGRAFSPNQSELVQIWTPVVVAVPNGFAAGLIRSW